jgi:hypothetical protein
MFFGLLFGSLVSSFDLKEGLKDKVPVHCSCEARALVSVN